MLIKLNTGANYSWGDWLFKWFLNRYECLLTSNWHIFMNIAAVQTAILYEGCLRYWDRNMYYVLSQVHKLLEDILAQWDSYHGELQAVNQTLAETEYCLQRYTMVGGDIATLKIQVEKLEVSFKPLFKRTYFIHTAILLLQVSLFHVGCCILLCAFYVIFTVYNINSILLW